MDKVGFGFVNATVVIVYLLFMLAVGSSFMKKASKSADAFFRAEGKLPGWAVGMSIFATTLSSITFMSIPEKSFTTDWAFAIGSLCIIPIIPILMAYYVPFFRKLNVTTAYQYLEERFNPWIRSLSSILFMIYHLGRIAVVIYLPVLAVASVTTINPILIAAGVGLICIVYTFLGGMEGVVWSDVIQGFVLLGGALLIIFVGITQIDGGFSTVAQDLAADNKFLSAANFNIHDLARFAPLIFFGQFFNSLYQYTGSQDVVQRYSSTGSLKETKQSLWITGGLGLLTIPLFFGMGSILYSFYKNNGGLPADFNTSALVPYFVLHQLPTGIGGLVIAGIFAAAQSTISSSLNSMSACFVVDFKQRFFNDKLQGVSDVAIARWVIVIAGIIGTLITIYFTAGNTSQTWEIFLTVSGLFGVPIAGIFALGIFTERANGKGVLIGFIASVVLALWANQMHISSMLVATLAFVSSFVFGYVASYFFPNDKKNIVGLTYSTRNEKYTGQE